MRLNLANEGPCLFYYTVKNKYKKQCSVIVYRLSETASVIRRDSNDNFYCLKHQENYHHRHISCYYTVQFYGRIEYTRHLLRRGNVLRTIMYGNLDSTRYTRRPTVHKSVNGRSAKNIMSVE